MTFRLPAAAFLLVCVAPVPLAQAGSYPTDVPALGYSASNMDRSFDPRQDFYHYAAGDWLRKTGIPATDPDVGGFSLLAHNLNDQLLKIIRGAADDPADKRRPTASMC
jgi:putative endopeptidase